MSITQQRITGKDLLNVGIFAVLITVLLIPISFIGFIPYLMPLYCVFMPLVAGIPWMLFAAKTHKRGPVFLLGILLSILLMLTGMGWYSIPLTIISSLLAELIIKKGNYMSSKHMIWAHSVFSLWVFGSFIPLFFMADAYWANASSYGDDYIRTAKMIFQPWLLPIMIVACIVFGYLGGLLGRKIMSKHFAKAGIV
ncbi:MAG TPA: MptD family putative ECF transporter S component [Clostridiaceae bacterium]|nr:MptD family putative ECF transporter S component [Clostridiaceae bacterium]